MCVIENIKECPVEYIVINTIAILTFDDGKTNAVGGLCP